MNPLNSKFTIPFLYGALAFVVIYIITSGGLGISFDSENYLAIANCFTEHEWSKAFNPVWPSLYPLTIVAVKSLQSGELFDAARIISILSFVAVVVLVYLLGLLLQGKFTAHFGSISTLFLAPLIYVYSFCWSETVYTAFSLLFLYLLSLFVGQERGSSTKYLVACSIAAGLGTATRYIGLSLILTGIISILFLLSDYHSCSKRCKKALAFLLVACIPVSAHYLLTCFFYHGLAVKRQFASPYSFIHQVSQFLSTIYHDFLTFDLSFWKYVFFFDNGVLFLWLRIIILVCGFVLLVFFLRMVFSSGVRLDWLKPVIPVLLYLTAYSSMILTLSSIIALDPMGSRFTAPLYPFIMLLLFSWVFGICENSARTSAYKLLFGLLFLASASFWAIQIFSTSSIYKGTSSGSFPGFTHPGNRNRKSLRFLRRNLGSHDIVITNVSRKLTWVWPRQETYVDIPRGDWDQVLQAIADEAYHRSVYVLVCTEDGSPYSITIENVEEAHKRTGMFPSRKIYGSDYVYKAEPLLIRQPGDWKQRE